MALAVEATAVDGKLVADIPVLAEGPSAAAEGSPNPHVLGVDRHTRRCWECSSILLDATNQGVIELRVISAWFGHPEREDLRADATEGVRETLRTAALGLPVQIIASSKLWGDPAPYCLKQLEVTYEQTWLTANERSALEALRQRACEKATGSPDIEKLLSRLGQALLGVGMRPACQESSTGCGSLVSSPALSMDVSSGKEAASASEGVLCTDPLPLLGRTSPRWKCLGFQACDPRTDLRTGRLALESLVYLAERYPLAAGQMAAEAQEDNVDYPFAVASINVTQILARYLGLLGDAGAFGASPLAYWATAPRPVVRRFARLLLGSERCDVDVFGELHAATLARLHTTWRDLKAADSQLTIMDFPQALDATMVAVHAFCSRSGFESALDFRGLSKFDPSVVEDLSMAAEEAPPVLGALRMAAETVSDTAGMVGDYVRGFLANGRAPGGRAGNSGAGMPLHDPST